MNITERPDVSAEDLHGIIENTLNGLKIYNVLKTSIELGVFDILEQEMTYTQLSEKLGIKPVMANYLLEILLNLKLVGKSGELYKNTRSSQLYLNSKSSYNRIRCISALKENVNLWNNLSNSIKGNITRKEEVIFPLVVQRMADDCLCGELQDTVELVAGYDEFKNAKTLLDLAGGHGMYPIAFSQVNPDLQCYVFDLPDVLEETMNFIEKYDSSVQTIPGNFYVDDFGGSYDVIFSSYNPGGKNPEIAEKVYNSLNMGGLFVNKQYFPENNPSSLEDVLDDMEWNFTNFEKSHKTGRKFTFKGDLLFDEYLKFLEDLGFSVVDVHLITRFNTPFGRISRDKIVIAKKVR
ncbi:MULTISPECIES: methyltransferase family protein [Methanobacterium]|uniref:Methyltransferase n=1 Tax=Methanobacterium bryantii TaxID=2161 RepID=A0A2A2H0V2_METBR|nr:MULTISPECIES: methyltransferase dimerization domain-containing protein [Methanobacterium]OEC86380.1 hypothetical protein A9507_00395 [Methanobacterium sp. A39]PAV03041.1 hypothetical protein ASJ80_07140 [Methanobacterium bryantii]